MCSSVQCVPWFFSYSKADLWDPLNGAIGAGEWAKSLRMRPWKEGLRILDTWRGGQLEEGCPFTTRKQR